MDFYGKATGVRKIKTIPSINEKKFQRRIAARFTNNAKVLIFVTSITFTAIFIGCGKKAQDAISIIPVFDLTNIPENDEPIPLSKIAKSVEYVPLESTDSSLLATIYKIVKRERSFYFHAKDAIFQFSINGEWLGKLEKTGKGPEEYSVIKDFDVSPSEQLIAILTWGKILIYKPNGELLKSIKHDARFINFVDDQKLLTYQSNMRGNGNYSHIMIDIYGDTIALFPNKFQFELKNKTLGLPPYEYLRYWYHNELYVSEIHDDTVFKVATDNTLLPYSIFYTGEKRLTAKARATGVDLFRHMEDYNYLTGIMESSRYVIYSDQLRNQIYDKKEEGAYSYARVLNDIDGGMDFQPELAFNKNYIISIIDAFKLKEHVRSKSFNEVKVKDLEGKQRLEQLVNGLSEEDNPVIMIVRLKD